MADKSVAVTGSFLLVKKGDVYLETADGTVSFKIESLSEADQKYVSYKQRILDQLNGKRPTEETQVDEASFLGDALPYSSWLAAILLAIYLRVDFKRNRNKASLVGVFFIFSFSIYLVSCNKGDDVLDSGDATVTDADLIGTEAMDAAFEPYKTLVSTSWDNEYFYVESTGMPDHQMMVGITAWIAQVPIPYDFSGDDAWAIPLNPEYSTEDVTIENDLRRGAIAIAANGIPIFNPINASGLVSKDIGELDEFGGHSGRGDDYHYHVAPLHLESTSGDKPIAYALDGYAIYGSKEPDGSDMLDLDEYHGHEYEGTYHYHGTTSYPFMVAKMRGKVTLGGTSPETQIEPQPVARALRKEIHPINSNNLLITNLEEKSENNGYVLTYTINGKEGNVDYYWDENGLHTFIFNDVDGTTTTETYQR